MDGFLLVIRCEVDDVPVGLFESKQDAISFAKSDEADDIRRLVESWRRRRVTL